jgi:hypothetical protein
LIGREKAQRDATSNRQRHEKKLKKSLTGPWGRDETGNLKPEILREEPEI